MQRSPLLGAAVALVLTIGVAACGDAKEKSAADIKKDLSARLQESRNELDEKTADCYADAIFAEIGIEKLRDVDLSDDEPKGDLADDIAAAASRADTECDPSGSGG